MKKILVIGLVAVSTLACKKPFIMPEGTYKVIQRENVKITQGGDTLILQTTFLDDYYPEEVYYDGSSGMPVINGVSYIIKEEKSNQKSKSWVRLYWFERAYQYNSPLKNGDIVRMQIGVKREN